MKQNNTEGSTTSLGSIIKDIRQKAKKNPLFVSCLKKLVNTKQILKLISKERIFLKKPDGIEQFETIFDAKNEFKFIEKKDFASLAKSSIRGPRPQSIEVEVYELVAHSRTSAMFSSFGEDLYLLSLTQREILDFIRHRKEYLTPKGTLFLLKNGCDSDANFHVVQVAAYDDGGLFISLVGLCFECGFTPYDRRIVVRKPLPGDTD